MGIFELFLLGFWVIFCAVIAGALFRECEFGIRFVLAPIIFLISLVSLAIFANTAKFVLKDGSPKSDILAGEYKVASIYEAGGNVTMELEIPSGKVVIPNGNEIEHIYSYQFPTQAFDGNAINKNAKKLVVVKNGNFKKPYLE